MRFSTSPPTLSRSRNAPSSTRSSGVTATATVRRLYDTPSVPSPPNITSAPSAAGSAMNWSFATTAPLLRR
ncbi:hypothetical protein [Actinoplanes sp. NPDC089786]|uniref:hypothetical protein n=1 Tax=Actinoplanes sp. NPDC089786 TaxID=3155185 RepID=UPI003441D9A3